MDPENTAPAAATSTLNIQTEDLYGILGIEKNATPKEITKAFHKKSAELHPDKSSAAKPDDAAFKKLEAAYEILKIS